MAVTASAMVEEVAVLMAAALMAAATVVAAMVAAVIVAAANELTVVALVEARIASDTVAAPRLLVRTRHRRQR